MKLPFKSFIKKHKKQTVMKKLANSLIGRALTLLSLLAIFNSCSKNESAGGGAGGGTVLLPTAPTKLVTKSDTALYLGSATITVTETDAQSIKTSNGQLVNGSITFHNITKDTVIKFIATNSNENGSKSTEFNIVLKCWSQKTTQVNNYGFYKLTSSKSCPDGQQNLPNPQWTYGAVWPTISETWIMYANGSGFTKLASGQMIPSSVKWHWTDINETAIDFGDNGQGAHDVWNVVLESNGYTRSQIKNGYYTVQVFVRI